MKRITYFSFGFHEYMIFHFQTVLWRGHSRLSNSFITINTKYFKRCLLNVFWMYSKLCTYILLTTLCRKLEVRQISSSLMAAVVGVYCTYLILNYGWKLNNWANTVQLSTNKSTYENRLFLSNDILLTINTKTLIVKLNY